MQKIEAERYSTVETGYGLGKRNRNWPTQDETRAQPPRTQRWPSQAIRSKVGPLASLVAAKNNTRATIISGMIKRFGKASINLRP